MSDGGENHAVFFPNEPARFEAKEWDDLLVHLKSIEGSDLHIKSYERARARVHGRIVPVTRRRIDHTEVAGFVRTLYKADNAELEIRGGTPLDGAYQIKLSRDRHLRFRWNAAGCDARGGVGIKATLRELADEPPPLPQDLQSDTDIMRAIHASEGLALVCGPTGSGKTTLLAGFVRYYAEEPDSDTVIETIEAPIEYTFDTFKKSDQCVVTQRSVPDHVPTFVRGVTNSLRCDPDVIIVGESRDEETIRATLLAATTGHFVFTTVHSHSVGSTFQRLLSQLPSMDAAATVAAIIDACKLIICQSLVPTLDGRRTAVRETLVFNDEIRTLLIRAAAKNLAELPVVAQEIVKRFGTTKLAHARQLQKEGVIHARYVDLIGMEQQRLASARGNDIAADSVLAQALSRLQSTKSSLDLHREALLLLLDHGEQLLLDADLQAVGGRVEPMYVEALHAAWDEIQAGGASGST